MYKRPAFVIRFYPEPEDSWEATLERSEPYFKPEYNSRLQELTAGIECGIPKKVN